MEIKGVIFDMDGLLIDTEKVYRKGWIIAADSYKVLLPDEFLKKASGRSIKKSRTELGSFISSNVIIDGIIKKRESFINEEIENGNVKLKPYYLELINFLKKRNIKTALATSSNSQRVETILKKYSLTSHFDIIKTGDMIKKHKPNPDIFLKVVKDLKLPKENLLILEDSLNGIIAAERAGISYIVVPDSSLTNKITLPQHYSNNSLIATNLNEVKEYISALLQ